MNVKGKNPITGRFEKGTSNSPENVPMSLPELASNLPPQEAPTLPSSTRKILWEKGDEDREGNVWSYRAPFREMRIAINRTRETRDPNAPGTEWLLLRFGAILAHGSSAQELIQYAEDNNL